MPRSPPAAPVVEQHQHTQRQNGHDDKRRDSCAKLPVDTGASRSQGLPHELTSRFPRSHFPHNRRFVRNGSKWPPQGQQAQAAARCNTATLTGLGGRVWPPSSSGGVCRPRWQRWTERCKHNEKWMRSRQAQQHRGGRAAGCAGTVMPRSQSGP